MFLELFPLFGVAFQELTSLKPASWHTCDDQQHLHAPFVPTPLTHCRPRHQRHRRLQLDVDVVGGCQAGFWYHSQPFVHL